MDNLKNLIQYRFRAESIFFHYLKKGLDIELLESSLKDLQTFIQRNENKPKADLWFRFFQGDTMVSTINDIINDLKGGVNKKYRTELIEDTLSNKSILSEIEVYLT